MSAKQNQNSLSNQLQSAYGQQISNQAINAPSTGQSYAGYAQAVPNSIGIPFAGTLPNMIGIGGSGGANYIPYQNVATSAQPVMVGHQNFCIQCFPTRDVLASYIYKGDSICRECLTELLKRKKKLEETLAAAIA